MTYLLDTDSLTLAYYQNEVVVKRISEECRNGPVAISPITRIEILRGRMDSVSKAGDASDLRLAIERLKSSEAFLATYPILEFDAKAFEHFERFRQSKLKNRMSRNDLLIACVALAHEATLITRNQKDFSPVPGLKITNWAN